MATVTFDGASRIYSKDAERPAVDRLNLDIADGEFLVLVGPSGCGKSTSLRMLAGLEPTDRGSIRIGGKDVTGVSPSDRDVAMVFQNYALYPNMSVAQNMSFALENRKVPKDEIQSRVHEAAKILQMEDLLDRKPANLSGGQRQRVAIARALALSPDAIIADEPTSALDVSVRAQILNLLTDLKNRLGLAMVFISHDIQTVRYVSDKIVVMNHGKIIEQGSAKEIFSNPKDDYTRKLLGAAPSLLHPDMTKIES